MSTAEIENITKLLCKYKYRARIPGYGAWQDMKARCKPYHKARSSYYDRGVGYCSRWEHFNNFIFDMGERPGNLYLDRIDNNLGYSKDNCRWATPYEQANNTRNTIKVRCCGTVWTLSEIRAVCGYAEETLRRWVNSPKFKCRLEKGY